MKECYNPQCGFRIKKYCNICVWTEHVTATNDDASS
jgi:hypothetical protein